MLVKKIMEEATLLGGFLFYAFISLLFLFNKKYFIFFMLLTGLIIMYAITLIIRLFYFKQRPERRIYKNLIEKIDASSFPSIHVARITFIFIILIFLSINIFLVGISSILTLLAFYSRIYLKKHDIIDVIAGVMLGIFAFIISFLIFYG